MPLNLVHIDLWGHSPIQSNSSYKYYILFRDDHTRSLWLYPIKNKGVALQDLIQYKNMVENQLEWKFKVLQSDWRGQFHQYKDTMQQAGIVFRHSCPYI